jgi:hypothetical protein
MIVDGAQSKGTKDNIAQLIGQLGQQYLARKRIFHSTPHYNHGLIWHPIVSPSSSSSLSSSDKIIEKQHQHSHNQEDEGEDKRESENRSDDDNVKSTRHEQDSLFKHVVVESIMDRLRSAGFVLESFLQGLNPDAFAQHSIGSREGKTL